MKNNNQKEFVDYIQQPLEQSDPQSFNQLKGLFPKEQASAADRFSVLIQKLCGTAVFSKTAIRDWHHILEHKTEMEKWLKRRVGIQAAAIDYFDQKGQRDTLPLFLAPESGHGNEMWLKQVYSPEIHLEKLKEEIHRSRRYRHALSAIMLDVDDFHKINDALSYKMGDKVITIIIKIIQKTIRNVDILSRYSGDRFFVILPNTNRREAVELAERLKEKVKNRTKRVEGLVQGVTLTLSVGQYSNEISSTDFLKQMENALIEGKRKNRDSVHTLL